MLASIGKFILDWLLAKLTDWIGGLVRFFQRKKVIEDEAAQSIKPIKDAVTEKEIDDAARDILNKL